jgi:arylsulfatase A-like enzyme
MPTSATPDNASPLPNIIWVFGDQHRLQVLGWMGDPNVHTPNLDRLAEQGLSSTAAA